MDTICHVITKLELGGAQEVALYAVSHLERTRFCPVLIAGPGGLLTDEACRLEGVQTYLVPSLGRRIHPINDCLALLSLIRLFRRLRPSIVHTHSSKAGILGRWAAWIARVPVVIHTVHGFGITPAQPVWLRSLFVLLERMTGWITTHWITVAEIDQERGRKWRLFDRNVTVIRPGIDPRPFHQPLDPRLRDRLREQFGAGFQELLVGSVACLKPQKAPEDIVLVAKRVCGRLPRARFVLIGDGDLRTRIEDLIERHNLRDRVMLAGWRRDVATAMKCFDALLLTSRWEGLPRVILEAKAAGLPIICTKVGGIEEIITNGSLTRLCQPGDIEGLATGVEEVLVGHGKEVRSNQDVEVLLPLEFHIEYMAQQYQSLYDRLLSQGEKTLMPHSWGKAA